MKRETFIALVDEKLTLYGYRPGTWSWVAGSAKLNILINDELKLFPLKANMGKEKLNFELGRLAGMAEILRLSASAATRERTQQVRRKIAADLKRKLTASPLQMDLETAIAGSLDAREPTAEFTGL